MDTEHRGGATPSRRADAEAVMAAGAAGAGPIDADSSSADRATDPVESRFDAVVGAGPSESDPAAPPERPRQKKAEDERIQALFQEAIDHVAPGASARHARLVRELLTAGLKLLPDGRHTGELKLMAAAVKELRHAYRVFAQYPDPHKVTIFGSARTSPLAPDYAAAVEFGRLMAEAGWMVITGAGDGIMKAGHEGPGRKASFGVAIRLPFETSANEIIMGDEKLINFRYFFTRKLMFLSQAEAVVCFPGGFGTMDEAFETLTLVQTGKAPMMPIVLCEGLGPGGGSAFPPALNPMLRDEAGAPLDPPPDTHGYWAGFMEFVASTLLPRGMINDSDLHLLHVAPTPKDAAAHVLRFYRNYHSSRYAGDDMVIRLKRRLPLEVIDELNDEFAVLCERGRIWQGGPHDAEADNLDLPRIRFEHTRRDFGILRLLIDRINDVEPGPVPEHGG